MKRIKVIIMQYTTRPTILFAGCYEKLFDSSSIAFMSQTGSQITFRHYEILVDKMSYYGEEFSFQVQLPNYTNVSHLIGHSVIAVSFY